MARSTSNMLSPLLLVNNPIGYNEVYSNVNANPSPTQSVTNAPPNPAAASVAMSSNSSPVTFWLIVIGLFVALILGARYANTPDEFSGSFKNIRPSVYNIVFIILAIAVGLPAFKLAAAKIPNVSLRDYLLSV
jgi:hypothetical protein